ncbi:hypothetical protein N7532_001195 [Penicillium argentinense]|uniref:Uncharacterized protein n=1 Tax=Penicillium argentinense TaxID=1131581 RepID=A0A9W9G2X3_9EURO|nr:uncharacterized protein N7532_001195 [Penicillium argentinense]KAJ5110660.1 hypothetical protein N7532_001195 [Penicillium argentinense]
MPYSGANNQMDAEVYSELTDTNGLDLESYYASLVDCYINGSGEVDVTATTSNGRSRATSITDMHEAGNGTTTGL